MSMSRNLVSRCFGIFILEGYLAQANVFGFVDDGVFDRTKFFSLGAQYAAGKILLSPDPEVHNSELGIQWLESAAQNKNSYATLLRCLFEPIESFHTIGNQHRAILVQFAGEVLGVEVAFLGFRPTG
mgnify:CR=1 FL=1